MCPNCIDGISIIFILFTTLIVTYNNIIYKNKTFSLITYLFSECFVKSKDRDQTQTNRLLD